MRRGERGAKAPADTDAPAGPNLWSAVRRILGLIGGIDGPGHKARLAAALVLTLVSKVAAVTSPLFLADGVNKLAAGQMAGLVPTFAGLVGLWAGLRFMGGALPNLRDALFQPISEEAQRRAGVAAFAHVHSLSIRYHQTKRTGSLQRTIERGVRSIDFLLRFLAFNIAPTLFELLLAAGVLWFSFGPIFAIIALVTVGVYIALTFGITEWRLQFRRDMNEADQEANARSVDSLLNFETVKSFAAEARETERYDGALRAYAKAAVRSNTSLTALNAVQLVIMNLGLGLVAVAAGIGAAEGRLGPGDVTAVVLLMVNLYFPLNVLGFAYREIKQSAIDMEKLFALFDEKPDVADAASASALVVKSGGVVFEAVSFAHEGRDRSLDGVSFAVAPGTTTAVVGPSGAGKSTVLKLLYRFYDPAGGRVLIDGQDIRAVTQASLREQLGLVPQDVVLFNDTIRYNIAYARPHASQQELDEAARRAQLLDFIHALPDGWETRVGERGLKLSGGEKQRVGIARVVLKDPKILILDEATSSLDSRTEGEVQAALDAAARGRTTIVVAHRLSTIVKADQIVVLKDGRIVERGDHASLVARGGEYSELWRRQAEEPAGRALA